MQTESIETPASAPKGQPRKVKIAIGCMAVAILLLSIFFILKQLRPAAPAEPAQQTQIAPPTFDKEWILSATQGWGQLNINTSVQGKPLMIGGVTYSLGLGTHADSRIEILVPAEKKSFSGKCGCDDEVGKKGTIICQILGDEKVLFESAVLSGGQPAVPFTVSTEGLKKLTLVIKKTDDGDQYDHGDWVDLAFQ